MMRLPAFLGTTVLLVSPAFAEPPQAEIADGGMADIVVVAERHAASVPGDIPPDTVLDVTAIESYGASSAADLLAALSAQTRSGRGRGNGPPVVLVNGKRVSGFAEVRDLPSEAIQRVEVLAEDVALRYGFTADQRVINFILKDNFAAVTAEVEYGGPTSGARDEWELQSTLLKLSKGGRINLSAQYDRDGSILERERGIIPQGADETGFRTLTPSNEAIALNAVINQQLSKDVSGTLNLRHDRSDTLALLGLPLAGAGPLARNVRSRSVNAGVTLDGRMGKWNWTFTGNHDRARIRTLTDRTAGVAPDQAISKFQTSNAQYSVTGPLTELPAGPVTLNLRAGFDKRRIRGRSTRGGITANSLIRRSEANTRANLDIPLASRRRGVADAIGDLSINLNGGYRKLSDFGGITAFGYGVNWSPVRGLNVLASFAAEQAAPSPQQLGDPSISTPNALVFDFARGTSALVTQITGGNPLLRAEERRDVKLGMTYNPPALENWTLSANYFRNRSSDPISSFPALTQATELAFPGRIVRDATGRLISVDQRPVNFLAARAEQLRWGISFAKEFAPPPGQGRPAGSGGPPRGAEGRPQGGPPGGGFGRFGGGRGGGGKRAQVSLYHSVKFRDEIATAAGVPVLDLLGGDATGQNGGSAQHLVDLEGGWFNKGFGLRVIASWQSATRVNGGALGDDLRFGDLATVNLRLFYNFDQQKDLIKRMPFLKGSRIAFRANNIFDAIQDVRDERGLVPFRYQRGYLDPVGRSWEISFRKVF